MCTLQNKPNNLTHKYTHIHIQIKHLRNLTLESFSMKISDTIPFLKKAPPSTPFILLTTPFLWEKSELPFLQTSQNLLFIKGDFNILTFLTFCQNQNGMPRFITWLITILALIETVLMIIWEIFHGGGIFSAAASEFCEWVQCWNWCIHHSS